MQSNHIANTCTLSSSMDVKLLVGKISLIKRRKTLGKSTVGNIEVFYA